MNGNNVTEIPSSMAQQAQNYTMVVTSPILVDFDLGDHELPNTSFVLIANAEDVTLSHVIDTSLAVMKMTRSTQ